MIHRAAETGCRASGFSDVGSAAKEDGAKPFCPHFGPCGGCQLQHLTYAAQLRNKASQLGALLDASELSLPELQLHPSPPLAYRNRIRLTLALACDELRAGYLTANQQANDEHPVFLPITECPIAAPILWRATESATALINEHRAVWLSDPHLTPDQLELVTAADESRLQLSLYLRTKLQNPPAKLAASSRWFWYLTRPGANPAPSRHPAVRGLLPRSSTRWLSP